MDEYVKISVRDVYLYPDIDGKTVKKEDENTIIQLHCVANMLTAFLGLRPVKEYGNRIAYQTQKNGNLVLDVPEVYNCVDKPYDWIKELANDCLYTIDSKIIYEVQTGYKPYYTRLNGKTNITWNREIFRWLNQDKIVFYKLLDFFETLTGVSPITLEFEAYADHYLRNKCDYSCLSDKKWCNENLGIKNTLSWLRNHIDGIRSYNDSRQGNNNRNNTLFDGKYGVNDVISTLIKHYTFDVSFYIPRNKAEELLNKNRSSINTDKKFIEILKSKSAAHYLGSPAVLMNTSCYLMEIENDLHKVSNGELYN